MEPRKLVALRDPLAPVEFPNGRVLTLREIDAPLARLIADATAAPTEEKYRTIFRQIVPDATDDDWASTTDEDRLNVLLLAGEKLETVKQLVEERRKNGLAGMIALGEHTRRLSPMTTSPTSAPASREPIQAPADTGTSNPRPTGKRSSRTTRSRKSNASTASSPNTTT